MIPLSVDAYQAGHFLLIPKGMEDFQCSQNTFRKPLIDTEHRIISAGLRMFVEEFLRNPITKYDIEEADWMYSDFHADVRPPFSRAYPWPKDLFTKVVNEHEGILPIVVTGLMDGQAHFVGEPNVQVWTNVPGMGELVGWIESSLLPYLWTMSTVATRVAESVRTVSSKFTLSATPTLVKKKSARWLPTSFTTSVAVAQPTP